MLRQPGMVGRALDGEIQRELQPVRLRRGDQQRRKSSSVPSCGMDRVVAAFRAADRIGAAEIARLGAQRVVAALAVGAADRVDRREIQHVEAHRADRRQPADHVVERAVARRIVRDRAREQLVPTGERRLRPIDIEP